MLAAPEAPARPEPTTMTWWFRLFAGFTSFMSKRCFSHFFSNGPDGTPDLRSMIAFAPLLADHADHDSHGEGDVPPDHRHGENRGESVTESVVSRMRETQRLEHAPEAVVEMEPQRQR